MARVVLQRWVLAALLLVGCALLAPAPGTAGPVKGKGQEAGAPQPVFQRIAKAWENGDERTLAGLVHDDGLRVTLGRAAGRVSTYSPNQAFYFFRNLFQAHRTLLFQFEMTQDGHDKGPVHGMATWKRRRPDSTKIQTVKLVCVLLRQDGEWRLAEINTIR